MYKEFSHISFIFVCTEDDGSCPTFFNRVDCLDKLSPFSTSVSYCEWTIVEGSYTCVYKNPSLSAKDTFIGIFFVTVVTGILLIPILLLVSIIVSSSETNAKERHSNVTLHTHENIIKSNIIHHQASEIKYGSRLRVKSIPDSFVKVIESHYISIRNSYSVSSMKRSPLDIYPGELSVERAASTFEQLVSDIYIQRNILSMSRGYVSILNDFDRLWGIRVDIDKTDVELSKDNMYLGGSILNEMVSSNSAAIAALDKMKVSGISESKLKKGFSSSDIGAHVF